MPRPVEIFIPLWERALEAEIGISVRTNQPQLLRQELYRAREAANRSEFQEIIMFIPVDRDEVFLCRKSVELD